MRRDEGWASACIALVMGGAVALAIAIDVTEPLCRAAKISSMAPDKIEFGCFEFWLNRYQGLIGNMITAAVAAATLWWLSRQLIAADRQIAVGQRQADVAAAQTLRMTLSELAEEIGEIDEALRLSAMMATLNRNFVGPIPHVPMTIAITEIDRLWKEINAVVASIEAKTIIGKETAADEYRTLMLAALRSVQANGNSVKRLLQRVTSEGIWDETHPVRRHLDKLWNDIANHNADASDASRFLWIELRKLMTANRAEIRRCEARARARQ